MIGKCISLFGIYSLQIHPQSTKILWHTQNRSFSKHFAQKYLLFVRATNRPYPKPGTPCITCAQSPPKKLRHVVGKTEGWELATVSSGTVPKGIRRRRKIPVLFDTKCPNLWKMAVRNNYNEKVNMIKARRKLVAKRVLVFWILCALFFVVWHQFIRVGLLGSPHMDMTWHFSIHLWPCWQS